MNEYLFTQESKFQDFSRGVLQKLSVNLHLLVKFTQMSKQETQILKGIAILMMVWSHIFNKGDVIELGNLIVVGGKPLVVWLVGACNPVSMFVALGGYGLYFTYRKGNDRHHYSRILKLYVHYWIILLMFVPVACYFNGSDRYIGAYTEILANITGYNCTWNYECWFLLPYSLLSLAYPIVFKVMNRYHPIIVLLVTFVLTFAMMCIIHFKVLDEVPWLSLPAVIIEFLFCFTSGALACKYNVVSQSKKWIVSKVGGNIQGILLSSMLFLVIMRCLIPHASWGNLYALIIMLIIIIMKRSALLDKGLIYLGNHSMNVWMIHTWFCTYIFHTLTWDLHFPLLIYIAVFTASLAVSYIVDAISKGIFHR